jgi:hypothetical protein
VRRLSIDEARRLPHLRARAQVEQQQPDVLHGADVTAPSARRNDGIVVDRLELRGLPVIGYGIAGVQPGTDPVQALLAKERRRR